MSDHKNYLKAAILSDGKIVTYRQLSRALKVHVNCAKEMLYEFHNNVNSKKPGTCHATYVISGLRKPIKSSSSSADVQTGDSKKGAIEDEDQMMQSSPFDSSMPEPKQTEAAEDEREPSLIRFVVLSSEELFEDVKTSFEIISSIHIYSLAPAPLNDLLVLADSSLEVRKLDISLSPTEKAARYGTIVHTGAKPRNGPILPKATPIVESKAKEAIKVEPSKPTTAEAPEEKKKTGAVATTTAKKSSAGKAAPAMKRSQSDIFKSFKNPPPKKKEPTKEPSPEPVEAESTKMEVDDEDDEDEDNAPVIPTRDIAKDAEARRKREEDLRKMMEDSEEEGEEEETVPSPSSSPKKSRTAKQPTSTASHKRKQHTPSPSPPPSAQKEPSPSSTASLPTTSNPPSQSIKKRGRRKVTKKVQSSDADGYLVTKNETVWESFSEDEVTPTPPPASSAKPKSTVLVKGQGKGGAAKGQGNIMSFFGKK